MLRDLSIRVFYIKEVLFGDKTSILNGVLTLDKKILEMQIDNDKRFAEYIKAYKLSIIKPSEKNIEINTVMDFIPISVKALGEIGEGITYTIHGAKFMLTGADTHGGQAAEFGSSEGILSEQVKFNKAGTPKDDEFIIHLDVLFYNKAISSRDIVNSAHLLTESIIKLIRVELKKLNAKDANERHDYPIKDRKNNAKKVVIIKEVAGQGAMYDTRIFAEDPSGFEAGYSVIDMNCMPVMISVNEYRDGAIRALY